MPYKVIRLDEDVYNVLYDLKYDYRERSLSATLAHIFRDMGIEPFDEEYDDEDEGD